MIDVRVHDLREFTTDRHHVVDDVPFGGGPGMVLKPEPLFAAVEAIRHSAAATRGRSGDSDVARRRAADAGDGAAAERTGARRCSCADGTKAWTNASGSIWRPRRFRSAITWCRAASCRRWSSSTPWRGSCPGVVGDAASVAGDTFARGTAGLPAVHASRGFSGLRRCRRAALGAPRGDREWRREQALERTRSGTGRICWTEGESR